MSLDAYRRRVIVLGTTDHAHAAARAMSDHQIGAVLVGDGDRLTGIVTDRDLALGIAGAGLDQRTSSLADLMSEDVATLDVGAEPVDAVRLMRDRACRRIPITEDGLLVGMITLDDLLADEAVDADDVRDVIRAQLERSLPPSEEEAREASVEARARARRRRRSRADAALARLVRAAGRNAGIDDRARTEQALRIVLGAICRRLTPGEARKLIAQLPSKLHADLSDDLDGPDKHITTKSIEAELQRELGLDQATAGEAMYAICEAVADAVSAGEIEDVRDQLPAAMKDLFPAIPYRRCG